MVAMDKISHLLTRRRDLSGIINYVNLAVTNIRNTEEAECGPQYSPRLSYWPRPVGPRSV